MRYDQTHARTATGTGLGRQAAPISPLDNSVGDAVHTTALVWAARIAWMDRGKGLAMTVGFWLGFVAGRMS